ncbi:MAG: hypothetical protein GY820_43875, partial [Gammaproteobacteria bacterium]|nr:hypothetical protein [Gammaproteobacteria bacterium]
MSTRRQLCYSDEVGTSSRDYLESVARLAVVSDESNGSAEAADVLLKFRKRLYRHQFYTKRHKLPSKYRLFEAEKVGSGADVGQTDGDTYEKATTIEETGDAGGATEENEKPTLDQPEIREENEET